MVFNAEDTVLAAKQKLLDTVGKVCLLVSVVCTQARLLIIVFNFTEMCHHTNQHVWIGW